MRMRRCVAVAVVLVATAVWSGAAPPAAHAAGPPIGTVEVVAGFEGAPAATEGPDGHVWYVDGHELGRIIDGVPTPLWTDASRLDGLVTAADGSVWVTRADPPALIRTAPGGLKQEFTHPGLVPPHDLSAALDGAVWFAQETRVGRVTPTGAMSFYDVPHEGAEGPGLLTAAADGLWFVSGYPQSVYRLAPDGSTTAHAVPSYPRVHNLIATSDGSVWFQGWQDDWEIGLQAFIGRIRAGTTWLETNEVPNDLFIGPDGNLWYGDSRWQTEEGWLGRVAADGSEEPGVHFEYPATTRELPPHWGYPIQSFFAGPNGTVWYVDHDHERLVSVKVADRTTRCVGGAGPFVDVDGTNLFCAHINDASRRGLMVGFGDGTFRPGLTVSRQALAAGLHRAAGSPAPTSSAPRFADVPASHPFFAPIQWAAEQGLVQGFPASPGASPTFDPTRTVSRQVLASSLWRLAGSPATTAAPGYRDVAPSHTFATPIAWARTSGVLAGFRDDEGRAWFLPSREVTRQVLAAGIARATPAS